MILWSVAVGSEKLLLTELQFPLDASSKVLDYLVCVYVCVKDSNSKSTLTNFKEIKKQFAIEIFKSRNKIAVLLLIF